MKYTFHQRVLFQQASPYICRVWIEIYNSCTNMRFTASPYICRVWIEIAPDSGVNLKGLRHPTYVGCGLKLRVARCSTRLPRHPTYVGCGLKCQLPSRVGCGVRSPYICRVWIEITVNNGILIIFPSPYICRVWIEIKVVLLLKYFTLVTLHM